MADSIREQVIKAAAAAITTAVGAVPVYRSRPEAFRPDQLPAVVVKPLVDSPSQQNGRGFCHFDWTLTLAVDVLVSGNQSDAVADPIVQQVHGAMLASPRDLGVAGVLTVTPGQTQWEMENAGTPLGVVRCTFTVQYRTSVADLAAV